MRILLALLLASAALSTLSFSDPIPVGETTVPAPPALVGAEGAVHLFWLNDITSKPPATIEWE